MVMNGSPEYLGEGKNLKSNKKYILELNVRGSTLDFKVDGIDMFSTTIPSILSKSQLAYGAKILMILLSTIFRYIA